MSDLLKHAYKNIISFRLIRYTENYFLFCFEYYGHKFSHLYYPFLKVSDDATVEFVMPREWKWIILIQIR
jgi:hypothetical protein